MCKATKIISMALAVLMLTCVLAAAPVSTSAKTYLRMIESGDYKFVVYTDDTAEIREYYGSDAVITLPDEIEGYSVTSIGYMAFAQRASLTEVTISDSITGIGDYAFEECTSLTKVTVSDSVTSIGEGAFNDCASLTDVTLGNSVSSIGNLAFDNCASLAEITLPDSITIIDIWAFKGCSSLANIIIPDVATDIADEAFADTAYYQNEANWEDDVLYIGKHLIKAKNTLSGDYIIKEDTISVANYAFDGCTNLNSVTIGNSVIRIGGFAFNGCVSFTGITIPDSVAFIGEKAFSYCKSLTAFDVSDNNKNYSALDGHLYNKDKTEFIQYALGKTDTSFTIPDTVKSIGNRALYSCTDLKSVTIGSSVTSIGEEAFYECSNLTSIKIPDSVTSIGSGAFYECTGLTSVTIGDGVTDIGDWAFDSCINLKSVTFGVSLKEINGWAFYNCRCLTSVTLPNGLRSIGDYGFYNCTGLTDVVIPESVTHIGDNAFGVYIESESDETGNLKLYGYKGSAAQIYAQANSIKFIEISDIGKASVSGIKSKTYNGKAQTQNVSVKIASMTLKNGTDYTVTYKNNKNAGTATVTITGKGSFTGNITKTFKINKAKNPMTVKAAAKTVSLKKVKKKALTVKAVSVSKAQGTVTFKKTSGSSRVAVNSRTGVLTVKKRTAKGKYTVKVKVTAKGGKNYSSGSKTVTAAIKVK